VRQLGLFAKYWQPGAVKTRLATTIGHREASRLYRAFLLCSLRRFATIADRRVLAFTPVERRADFESLAGGAWAAEAQAAGDLGHRMQHYFTRALASDMERVVLIGSDSPTLPLEYVTRAFDLLIDHPVVLGPSGDGGYYLVGASGNVPPIFSGIRWSSPQVWDQTVALLECAGRPFAVLPPWYDVDDADSLKRLYDELNRARPLDETLRGLSDAVGEAVSGD